MFTSLDFVDAHHEPKRRTTMIRWSMLVFAMLRVRYVILDTSDRIKFQNEARTKAILAAREKATAIAETLGVKIGRPLSVEEDLSTEPYRNNTSNIESNDLSMTGSAAGSDQVAPGFIPITARMKAAFLILEK
jgi:uncharacterized protein YggE